MADENDTDPEATAAPKSKVRGFVPSSDGDLFPPRPESNADPVARKARPRGIPVARVNPKVAREFAEEVNDKVTSGRSRMRWFANHLMLFVVAIVTAVTLHFTIFSDIDIAYFQLALVAWVGILALHARYAIGPILRRSDKESQLKAVIRESERDTENGG
jgi:hypothetical protein